MQLDDKKKGFIFKALATKSFYDVGIQFGLDKHYKTAAGVKNAIHRIYKQIQVEPERYAISPDLMELVTKAVSDRKIIPYNPNQKTLKEQKDENDNKTFPVLATEGRDKIIKIIHNKMDRIMNSRKKLDAVSIGEMAKVYSIMFDKSQIIRGEATEHVKVLSKNVDDKLSPQERIEMVLKMREVNNIEKEKERGK